MSVQTIHFRASDLTTEGIMSRIRTTVSKGEVPTDTVKENRDMAFQTVDFSKLPSGKPTGEPAVTIKDNGQLSMNKKAHTALGNPKALVVQTDNEKHAIRLVPSPKVEGPGVVKLTIGKVTGAAGFSRAALLRQLEYEYAKGHQRFVPQFGKTEKGTPFIVLVLTQGQVVASRPKKPKAPAEANGSKAPAAKPATKSTAAPTSEEVDELAI